MTREDYSNYGCGRADLLIAVSDLLRNSVREWHHDREVVVIPDGLADEEFLPPKSPLKSPPERILVLGDASARKGWKDLVAALEILLKEGKLPTVNFDFTDIRPPWLKTSNFGNRCTLNFIGHRDDFRDLVRQYELVINPSRSESFGMAALEVIAAGIPLLSSRSGVIEDIIEDPRFLFEPHNPMSLAAVLHDLLVHGSSTGYDLESNQHKLRNRFPIKGNVEQLLDQYKKLFT
jgi:glycosyltransferase involved in cell wall biosynthesis